MCVWEVYNLVLVWIQLVITEMNICEHALPEDDLEFFLKSIIFITDMYEDFMCIFMFAKGL